MMSEYDTFISIILRGQEGRRGVEQAPLEDGIQETVFDVPPEHIIQSSRGRGWNGLDVAEVIHPLDDFALPAIPRHVLVINLGSPSEIKEHLVGRQGHLGTGNLVILPAGAHANSLQKRLRTKTTTSLISMQEKWWGW